MDARVKAAFKACVPAALLVIDRLLKHRAWEASSLGNDAISSMSPAFGFFLNKGMLFSSFGPAVATAASALAFAALAAFALYRAKAVGRFPVSALVAPLLIALGGASNIFDRLAYGGVIDYLLFARSAWNIADIMILAGLLFFFMKESKGGKRA